MARGHPVIAREHVSSPGSRVWRPGGTLSSPGSRVWRPGGTLSSPGSTLPTSLRCGSDVGMANFFRPRARARGRGGHRGERSGRAVDSPRTGHAFPRQSAHRNVSERHGTV